MGFEILSIEAKGELEDLTIKNRIERLFAINDTNQLLFRYVKIKDHPPVAIFPIATVMSTFSNQDYKNQFHVDIKFKPAQLKDALNNYLLFLQENPAYACAKLLIPVIGKYTFKPTDKDPDKTCLYMGLLEINVEDHEISLNFYESGSYDVDKDSDLCKERTIQGHVFENLGTFVAQDQIDKRARYQLRSRAEGKSTKLINTHYLDHRGETSFNCYDYVTLYLKFILVNGTFDTSQIKIQVKDSEIQRRKRLSRPPSFYRGTPEHELQNVTDFARNQSVDSASTDDHALLEMGTASGTLSSPHISNALQRDLKKAQGELEQSLTQEKQTITIKLDEVVPKRSTSKVNSQPPLNPSDKNSLSWLPQKPNTTHTTTPSGDVKSQSFWSNLGHFISDHRITFTLAAAWIAITGLLMVGLIFPPAFLVNLVGVGVLGAHGSVITAMGLGSLSALEGILTLAGLDLFLFAIAMITTVAIATYSAESLAAADTPTASKMTPTTAFTGKTATMDAQPLKPSGSAIKQPPLPSGEYFHRSRTPSPNPSGTAYVPTPIVAAASPKVSYTSNKP